MTENVILTTLSKVYGLRGVYSGISMSCRLAIAADCCSGIWKQLPIYVLLIISGSGQNVQSQERERFWIVKLTTFLCDKKLYQNRKNFCNFAHSPGLCLWNVVSGFILNIVYD